MSSATFGQKSPHQISLIGVSNVSVVETSGVLSGLILLYPEGFGKKLLGNRKLPNFPKNSGTNQALQCLKNGSPNKRFKRDCQRVAFPV
ncbi:hypothetical protein, partial [Vibrio cholerae]|uniref:hypothetical protein n=2 Tax=Vibrio cholerae TaxID=666 RepID=UPI003530FCE7